MLLISPERGMFYLYQSAILFQKTSNRRMVVVEPETIFWGVLGFMWIEFLWEGYIGRRQRKIYNVSKIRKIYTRVLQCAGYPILNSYPVSGRIFGEGGICRMSSNYE